MLLEHYLTPRVFIWKNSNRHALGRHDKTISMGTKWGHIRYFLIYIIESSAPGPDTMRANYRIYRIHIVRFFENFHPVMVKHGYFIKKIYIYLYAIKVITINSTCENVCFKKTDFYNPINSIYKPKTCNCISWILNVAHLYSH